MTNSLLARSDTNSCPHHIRPSSRCHFQWLPIDPNTICEAKLKLSYSTLKWQHIIYTLNLPPCIFRCPYFLNNNVGSFLLCSLSILWVGDKFKLLKVLWISTCKNYKPMYCFTTFHLGSTCFLHLKQLEPFWFHSVCNMLVSNHMH